MLNFFAFVLIFFMGILLLILKQRSFKKFIIKGKLHSIKLKKHRKNNNQLLSNKKSILYNHEEKSTHYFIKILKGIKCLVFLKVIKKTN